MPEIKSGDRVTVTIEGVVTHVEDHNDNSAGVNVRYADSFNSYGTLDGLGAASTTEVARHLPLSCVKVIVEPTKPGDAVTEDNIDGLPVGSVILAAEGLTAQKRNLDDDGDIWYTPGGGFVFPATITAFWSATVLHVGDGAK